MSEYPQYKIKSDEHNFILVEIKQIKSGKTAGQLLETNIGCYGTLANLIRATHNKMLMVHGLDQVETAMKHAEYIVSEAVHKVEKIIHHRAKNKEKIESLNE